MGLLRVHILAINRCFCDARLLSGNIFSALLMGFGAPHQLSSQEHSIACGTFYAYWHALNIAGFIGIQTPDGCSILELHHWGYPVRAANFPVVSPDGKTVYVGAFDGHLYAVATADGVCHQRRLRRYTRKPYGER